MYQAMHLKEEYVLRENEKKTAGTSFVRPIRHINNQAILQFAKSDHLLNDIRINYNIGKTASFKESVCQMEEKKFLDKILQGNQKIEGIPVELTFKEKGISDVRFIMCEILDHNIPTFAALKMIARLQRYFYNLYKQNPNLAGCKCICITYKVNIFYEAEEPSYDYMQEVVYSPQGEGYVVKEVNDQESTILDQREQLTGEIESGETYKGGHAKTGEETWIDLLEGGTGTGDNGSKLTAENARFQLLMEDNSKTSDSTWYLLSDESKIIYVNALNLTDNFDTVRKWRKKNRKDPAILPMENKEVASAIQAGCWKPKGRGPVVYSKIEWIDRLIAQDPNYYFSSISDFDIEQPFYKFIHEFENYQGFVILYINRKEYKIKCPEFVHIFLNKSINGTAGMTLMKTAKVISVLEKRLNENVIAASLMWLKPLTPFIPLKGNNTPEGMKRIWFFDAATGVLGKPGASIVYSSDFKFPQL